MLKGKGDKVNMTVLDEAHNLDPKEFKKALMDMTTGKMAQIELTGSDADKNPFNDGQNYVFTQNDVVKGVGTFVGRNRVSGQLIFNFDKYLPDDQYIIIISGREKYAVIKKQQEFYYIHNGQYVGNSMMWWRKGNAGYTSNIREAQMFTREEAINICKDKKKGNVAWLSAHIDDNTVLNVDMQYVNKAYALEE